MTKLDLSNAKFSWKDKIKGVVLPTVLSEELAEDVGIHIGDGCMNIYPNPNGTDYYYKCGGHPENEKLWFDNFIVPLKRHLFNLSLEAKNLSDKTYGIQFRSKAIVEFYHKVIGIPLGAKSKNVSIPPIIKSSNIEIQLACLRGIFDADFSLTFKRKYKDIHYYPVIKGEFASKQLVDSIKLLLTKLEFKFFSNVYSTFDSRSQRVSTEYYIFLSGETNLKKWFDIIGSNNPNNLTKFEIWERFGFCPPKTTLDQRSSILLNGLNPLKFEN